MESLKVLFIGNSKTYRQNFLRIFKNMVSKSGKEVYIDKATKPGASLIELYEIPETVKKIKSQKWDYVILQERTIKALQDDISEFKEGVNCIYKKIKENSKDTKIIYNVVWISNSYNNEEQEKSNKHYEEIATKTDGILSYSGNAFMKFHSRFPDIELYEDEKHPSLAGAYLSACCLYDAVYQQKSEKVQYYDILNHEIAIKLQKVADEIMNV